MNTHDYYLHRTCVRMEHLHHISTRYTIITIIIELSLPWKLYSLNIAWVSSSWADKVHQNNRFWLDNKQRNSCTTWTETEKQVQLKPQNIKLYTKMKYKIHICTHTCVCHCTDSNTMKYMYNIDLCWGVHTCARCIYTMYIQCICYVQQYWLS